MPVDVSDSTLVRDLAGALCAARRTATARPAVLAPMENGQHSGRGAEQRGECGMEPTTRRHGTDEGTERAAGRSRAENEPANLQIHEESLPFAFAPHVPRSHTGHSKDRLHG
ncbi:hypothetical protein ACFWVC_33160 [Streptomyces sp. NPDC058691]|uniref:hypothetical protein n=1 Tax=Streptomyces sp. NPDC058691 TaxID=3346601 RepID=UPI003658F0A9